MKDIRFFLGQIGLWTACILLLSACGTARPSKVHTELPRTAAQNRLYDYYYTEAVKQKILGHHDESFQLLQYCRELNPQAGETLYDLGMYALLMRQDTLAEEYLLRAATLEPDNIWYRETLSSYYLSRSEWGKAQECLEEMIRLNPKRSDVMMHLVNLYQNEKKYAQAIGVLNRVETLEGKSLQLAMEKYWLYMQLKEKEKAYGELKSLIAEYPNDLSYQVVLGREYLVNDEIDLAKQIFDDVAKKEPNNTFLLQAEMDYAQVVKNDSLFQASLNRILFGKEVDQQTKWSVMKAYAAQQPEDSLYQLRVKQTFKKLLAEPETGIEIWMLYAVYQITQKESPDSIEPTWNRVLQLQPDNQAALQELLRISISKQNFRKIERLCDKAVQYYPDMVVFYYYKAMAHYQLDEKKQAIATIELGVRQEIKDEDKGMISDMYSILGDLYHEQKLQEKSYAAYDSALVYNSKNLGALNNYAYFLSLENKDLDKAQEMSYKTVQAESDNVVYLDTYAWILFLKEKYTEAKVYMDKIVGYYENEPESEKEKESKASVSGGVLEHAGDIYFLCGEADKALKYWKIAQEMGDVSPLLSEKLKQKKYIAP